MGTAVTLHTAQGAKLKAPPIKRIFAVQGILLLLVSLSAWVLSDPEIARSILLGGLISIGPNVYFARWAFRFSGAQASSSVARSFYIGEAGKFFLTVVMFAAVFAWVKPLNIPILFLTYIVMMALNWILALSVINK